MRILHTSDWHLGRVLHQQPLLPDQEVFIDAFLALCAEGAYDAVVLSGDVFDRSVPSEETVKLWNHFLEGFCDLSPAPVLCVIAGNHDSATRVSMASKIVERAGIHIRGGADRIGEPVKVQARDGGIARLWLLPFLWGGSLAQDVDGEAVYLHTQEAVLSEAMTQVRALLRPDELNILAAHCFAAGGAVSDSERLLVGTAAQVQTSLFEGFDYVALGHLHRPQTLGERIAYSGSPLPYSFSEAGQAKSLLSVTLALGTVPVLERIALPSPHPMVCLQGTLEELLDPTRFLGLESSYVRVRLTRPSGLANPFARLRGKFPLLMEFDEAPEAPTQAGSAGGAGTAGPQDIGEEFKAFEQRLRGAEPPAPLQAAFTSLQQELEQESAR